MLNRVQHDEMKWNQVQHDAIEGNQVQHDAVLFSCHSKLDLESQFSMK